MNFEKEIIECSTKSGPNIIKSKCSNGHPIFVTAYPNVGFTPSIEHAARFESDTAKNIVDYLESVRNKRIDPNPFVVE